MLVFSKDTGAHLIITELMSGNFVSGVLEEDFVPLANWKC